MADAPVDVRDARDPILERIRSRVNPLDSAKDFQLYEAEKGAELARGSQSTFRALVHLPPIDGEMTEAQRQALLAKYTGMLADLKKVESSMKAEDMKSQRGYQTAMSNLSSALLKYAASENASYATTVSSAMQAATERMTALSTEQDLYGTATLPDKVRSAYAEDIKDLATSVSPDGTIRDGATYYTKLDALLKKTKDPREVIPLLSEVAATAGVTDPQHFITSLSGMPKDAAAGASLRRQLAAGQAAYASAMERQEQITGQITEVDQTFRDRAKGEPGWVQDMLAMSMRGIAGIDTKPSPELAAALGIGPMDGSTTEGGVPQTGPDGKPIPGSKTAYKLEANPYTADAKAHIEQQIDALMAGTDPRYVQLRKAMISSDAFKKFKEIHGYEDDEVAFQAWGKAAKFHASKTKADTRAAMDREILSGRQEAGVLDQAGARVRTAIRDLFGGKKKTLTQKEATDVMAAGEETPDDSSTPLTPTGTPAEEADPTSPEKPALASQTENPSAGITNGSSPPVTTEEKGGSKSEARAAASEEKAAKYRIVNDPRNPDYIYRQYADGRIELIGTPNDATVSPKNPRAQTGSGKTKVESVIGAYVEESEKPDPKKTALDLEDVQPSPERPPQGENMNMTPKARGNEGAKIGVIEGIARAGSGDIKMGASGPGLKLGRAGELVSTDKPHTPSEAPDPNLVKPEEKGVKGVGNSRGEIDYSKEEADARMKMPVVNRKEATRPLSVQEQEVPLEQKLNPGLIPVSPEEKKRRATLRKVLLDDAGYDTDTGLSPNMREIHETYGTE